MNLSPSGTQTRRTKPNAKKRRRLRGDARCLLAEAQVFESESVIKDFDDDLPELLDDPDSSPEEVISTDS